MGAPGLDFETWEVQIHVVVVLDGSLVFVPGVWSQDTNITYLKNNQVRLLPRTIFEGIQRCAGEIQATSLVRTAGS